MRARRAAFITTTPESGHDGGTCTREPRLCRPVPWLLGYVVLIHGSGRSDAGRLLPSPPSMTMGELVEPAGLAPAPCGLKVRCATLTPQLRGARAGTRTRNCGLADRRVALTLRTHLNSKNILRCLQRSVVDAVRTPSGLSKDGVQISPCRLRPPAGFMEIR